MAETTAKHNETVEQPEVPKEEISSATEVIQAIIKTSKAFKMYLSNNPLLHRFLEDLKKKMGSHLEEYGELRLDIGQFDLRYRGKMVYENIEPKESFAFKMYSDGIRCMIFSEGIEDREIEDFLEIVGKDQPGEIDDDMVTLLWMKELPHITYLLAEDYLEFDSAGVEPADPASKQENIRGLYNAIPSAPPAAPAVMPIPQNILTLTEDEIDWLKKAKEIDETRNPLEEVIHILSSILSVEKDFFIFGEFVDITANLIGNLIRSGNIDYALSLIKLLRDLSKNENISSFYKDRLAQAMNGAASEDIIKALEEIIEADKINPESLKELLLLFGKSSIRPICEVLGTVQKMEIRKAIIDALAEIGKEVPETFIPLLSDKRWYLARNAVLILRKIGNPASLEPVSKMINHTDPRIRKEVLLYLETVPDPKAKPYIQKFIRDENSSLRIYALKSLGSSKNHDALKPIFDMITSKDFNEKDFNEKNALFEALGEIGSDEVVPTLKEMLIKKYWFKKEKEKETVALAVAGLKKVGTSAALKALEEAASGKKDDVRAIITQAIKFITAEKTRVRR